MCPSLNAGHSNQNILFPTFSCFRNVYILSFWNLINVRTVPLGLNVINYSAADREMHAFLLLHWIFFLSISLSLTHKHTHKILLKR